MLLRLIIQSRNFLRTINRSKVLPKNKESPLLSKSWLELSFCSRLLFSIWSSKSAIWILLSRHKHWALMRWLLLKLNSLLLVTTIKKERCQLPHLWLFQVVQIQSRSSNWLNRLLTTSSLLNQTLIKKFQTFNLCLIPRKLNLTQISRNSPQD